MPHPLLVAVATILNDQGEVLIAQRPPEVEQGGLWEFPGGKLAPYETGYQALQREIQEELGIKITRARPLIRINHTYPTRRILLDVWKVKGFEGEPWGREGQPVRWVKLEELRDYQFPEANDPIVNALTLPDEYLITGSCQDLDAAKARLNQALDRGVKLVQLRDHQLDSESYLLLAKHFLESCNRAGARLILNTDPDVLDQVAAAGVHLTGERLMSLSKRPLPKSKLVSAACHDLASVRQARAIDADLITLSPVLATPSHPDALPLGWQRFKELVEYEVKMPVYALGGMRPEDKRRVFALGGQGVAGISHFW